MVYDQFNRSRNEVTKFVEASGDQVAVITGGAVDKFLTAAAGGFTFLGFAAPGVATSAATWKISRITDADDTILWADGNGDYDNVWDDRASLSYS